MSQVSATIFNQDVSVYDAENTPLDGGDSFRFSGRLKTSISTPNFGATGYTQWIHVASRDGDCTVTINYGASTETFTVRHGYPLHFLTSPPASGSTSIISFAPVGEYCDVEIECYLSTFAYEPQAAEWVILNAGSGVEYSVVTKAIESWRDTQPLAPAPDTFDINADDGLLTYIDSDPEFNGKPSVDFAKDSLSSLKYPSSTDFDFLMGDEDWAFFAILKPVDYATGDASDSRSWMWTRGGASILRDGGFRPGLRSSTFAYDTEEFAEKPTVLIVQFDASSGSCVMYWQGRWRDPIVSGALVNPSNQTMYVGNFVGKFADMRWVGRVATDAEIADYISMATSEYGVDDTEEVVFPLNESTLVSYHRATRGYSSVDMLWYDVRYDYSDVGFYDFIELKTDSTVYPVLTQSEAILNNRPAWQFDGAEAYMKLSAANYLMGGATGSTGCSVMLIFYADPSDAYDYKAILSMGTYLIGTPGGLNLYYYGNSEEEVYARLENASDGVVSTITVANQPPSLVPMLAIFEYELASGESRLTYANLESGAISYGTYDSAVAPGAVAPAEQGYLFYIQESFGADTDGWLGGALAEYAVFKGPLDGVTRTQIIDYAVRVYGPPADDDS